MQWRGYALGRLCSSLRGGALAEGIYVKSPPSGGELPWGAPVKTRPLCQNPSQSYHSAEGIVLRRCCSNSFVPSCHAVEGHCLEEELAGRVVHVRRVPPENLCFTYCKGIDCAVKINSRFPESGGWKSTILKSRNFDNFRYGHT